MSFDNVDISHLKSWVGRQETQTDVITPAPVARLSATLDHSEPRARLGEPLPECWHWLYFQPDACTAEIAADGHPQRGRFLPPVPLPRRMWAGSELVFHAPLLVGDAVSRVSVIDAVDFKNGSTGPLVFVQLTHRLYARETLCIEEKQTLVYRSGEKTANSKPSAKAIAPLESDWKRVISPSPVLLFRYSALTFNAHRIHYDRDYATNTEGYEGLVVQGPLTATLLLDLVYRELPGACVKAFSFRGLRALHDASSFTLLGSLLKEEVELRVVDADGELAMTADVRLIQT
ncbi:MAG: MaoC family dehydratase N-terminal domain-containing protein [Halioglobus sp.]